jgi:hypothetical protein
MFCFCACRGKRAKTPAVFFNWSSGTCVFGQLPFINWLEYPADPLLLSLALAAPLPDGFAAKVEG